MKNRKIVVVAFLLAAVMLLGVGYAALTDTLDITGSADVDLTGLNEEFEEDIYFLSAVANEGSPNTASVNTDNNDKASFSAKSLKEKGDTATFTFTIVNKSAHEVVVTPKLNATLGNTNTEYFEITSDWNGESRTIPATTDDANPSTITYTVTITLKKDPTEAISGSFLVELTAVADNAATTNP